MRTILKSNFGKLFIFVVAVGLLAVTQVVGASDKNDDQVTICHIPPGNPANAHTITVGASAVQTHIDQHGDTLGACAVSADNCDECAYSQAEYSSSTSCVATCGILVR